MNAERIADRVERRVIHAVAVLILVPIGFTSGSSLPEGMLARFAESESADVSP